MTQNGREAATSLVPAPIGNRRAAKHLAYASFTPAELEEVRSLEEQIRALCPVDSPSIEPAVSVLAGAMWRRAKLYAYIDEAGMTRARNLPADSLPYFRFESKAGSTSHSDVRHAGRGLAKPRTRSEHATLQGLCSCAYEVSTTNRMTRKHERGAR